MHAICSTKLQIEFKHTAPETARDSLQLHCCCREDSKMLASAQAGATPMKRKRQADYCAGGVFSSEVEIFEFCSAEERASFIASCCKQPGDHAASSQVITVKQPASSALNAAAYTAKEGRWTRGTGRRRSEGIERYSDCAMATAGSKGAERQARRTGVGDCEVLWGGDWWAATMSLKLKDQVLVSYVGGTQDDDEWIPANEWSSRIRAPQPMPEALAGCKRRATKRTRLKSRGFSKLGELGAKAELILSSLMENPASKAYFNRPVDPEADGQ